MHPEPIFPSLLLPQPAKQSMRFARMGDYLYFSDEMRLPQQEGW
jgi:hypothetical protein